MEKIQSDWLQNKWVEAGLAFSSVTLGLFFVAQISIPWSEYLQAKSVQQASQHPEVK